MYQYSSITTPFNESLSQSASSPTSKHSYLSSSTSESTIQSSIHILDDDSLLNIFYFCRPNIFYENQDRENRIIQNGGWSRECWWYKLVQVCRRWRHRILESAIHLHLCLVCTHSTSVGDMLAIFPPFPLIIELDDANQDLTAKDEEEIMLALQHRERVLSVHLEIPVPRLQRILMAIDGDFPMLEYMHILPSTKHETRLTVSPTFEAPHLRHLVLYHFAFPIGSRLLTTAVGLVTLLLRWIQPPPYPSPNNLLEILSHFPQLETLQIGFRSPVPNHDIRRKLSRSPVNSHVTLPNLHWFSFAGVSAYLEALLPHMTTPLLETLKIHFFNQLSYPVPRLLRFVINAEKFNFNSARFCFHGGGVAMWVFPPSETMVFAFYVHVLCEHLDWQVSSVAQIFNVLEPAFSAVVDLALDYTEHGSSLDGRKQADRTLWRKLLESFRNLKTLRVHDGLVGELSDSLRSDEEPPLELLPELKEVHFPSGSHGDEVFAPFRQERQLAGRPINLISSSLPIGLVNYVVRSPAGVSHIRR